jgi:hypothetical protein
MLGMPPRSTGRTDVSVWIGWACIDRRCHENGLTLLLCSLWQLPLPRPPGVIGESAVISWSVGRGAWQSERGNDVGAERAW